MSAQTRDLKYPLLYVFSFYQRFQGSFQGITIEVVRNSVDKFLYSFVSCLPDLVLFFFSNFSSLKALAKALCMSSCLSLIFLPENIM